MEQFSFKTKIISGPGSISALGAFEAKRLYLVTDPYFYQNGTVNHIAHLSNAEEVAVFHKITPDPSVALAAEGVDEFRRRIDRGGIVEYEQCPTSHVELKPDGTYAYCTLHHHMPLTEYLQKAEAARAAARTNGSIEEEAEVQSMYFISTLPWLHYTQLIQPVACGEESNPRFTWGKYQQDADGRMMMPLSVLVHHALADGLHIAKFYERFDKQIKGICEEGA